MATWDSNAASKGGIWWSNGNMKGWKMVGSKRYIQRYFHDGTYGDISDGLTSLSWAWQGVWNQGDYLISYGNPVNNDTLVKTVTIKCISCNSGGRRFYGAGGRYQPVASGRGATYHCIVKTFSSYIAYVNKIPYQVSSTNSIVIPPMSQSNLIQPGSRSRTASFAYINPYSIHTFNFENQKVVIPRGGYAIIQLGVSNFTGSGNGFIQFDMIASDSPTIDTEELIRPYIWKFDTPQGESRNRWHLVKPAYIRQPDGTWKPLEDVWKSSR